MFEADDGNVTRSRTPLRMCGAIEVTPLDMWRMTPLLLGSIPHCDGVYRSVVQFFYDETTTEVRKYLTRFFGKGSFPVARILDDVGDDVVLESN